MAFQPGANLYTQGFGSRPESVEVPHIEGRVPSTSDIYPVGKRWTDTVGDSEYVLTSLSTVNGITSANWALLGTAGGELNTLTGDTGGAVTPNAGNINIVGGADVSVSGSGDTLTININPDTETVATLTGNTGGPVSPSSGNIDVVGAGALSFAGSGDTLTGTITPGTALLSTLTGTSGGAISPTAGNITFAAGTNVTSIAGTGSTLTFNVGSSGLAVTTVTTDTSMAVNNAYITNKAGTAAAMLLPATASVGALVQVVGLGATGWSVTQNSGQTIRFNSSSTTTGTGGSLSSTAQYNVVTLMCTVTNTDWTVISSEGTLTGV